MHDFENKALEVLYLFLSKKIKEFKFCGSKIRIGQKKNNLFWVCKWNKCRRKASIFKNTIFYRRKQDFKKITFFLYLWMEEFTTKQIKLLINLSKKSQFKIPKKMRNLILPKFYENFEKIGGPSIIVEMDESKFGKVKH